MAKQRIRGAQVTGLDVLTYFTLGGVTVSATAAELNTLGGFTGSVVDLNNVATGGAVQAREVTFTETGAGIYTGSVTLPAGATLLDVLVNGVVLWAAATSAAMDVGDATDPNGYYAAIDLKATDLLAGESISFALAGGKAGAYIAASQVSPRYSATERVISGIVTSVGAGTAGRTRMTVVYSAPATATAATKV